MKPSAFRYEKPKSLDELLSSLTRHGEEAKILAGGQSLVPMMNYRIVAPAVLIDVNGLSDLDYIRVSDNTLAIGALTRHETVYHSEIVQNTSPLVTDAYRHIAHKVVRNRGTIGGNICHSDPASEMPAVAACLDASFVLKSSDGERSVPASEFFLGPFETAVAPTEALTEIRIPVSSPNAGWSFQEVSPRKGDFAIAAIAATISLSHGVCTSVRLSHAGVAAHTNRLLEAESHLAGKTIDAEVAAEAAAIAASGVEPSITNYHGDEAYKLDLIQSLCARAILQAADRCSV